MPILELNLSRIGLAYTHRDVSLVHDPLGTLRIANEPISDDLYPLGIGEPFGRRLSYGPAVYLVGRTDHSPVLCHGYVRARNGTTFGCGPAIDSTNCANFS
jgi:hypothetical protein